MNWKIRLGGILEAYTSKVLTLIVGILILIYKNSFEFIQSKEYLTQLTTISAALFAFLLTILTVIVQSDSKSVLIIKAHPIYKKFLQFNKSIVFRLLGVTIISVLLSFASHIITYINVDVFFALSVINTCLFFWASVDSIYFTLLFYILIMLEVKQKK